jgi:uncharacterized protein (TIGR00299 family) protein
VKICVIDPFTGLAGDMLLAALIDAGAPEADIRATIAGSGISGWDLRTVPMRTHGLTTARVRIEVSDPVTARSAAELVAMVGAVRPAAVAERAVTAIQAIAEVEARLHGEDPEKVHLHELGGHDTVIDVVGVLAALHFLDVSTVYCKPLPLGTGTVQTAHGLLPVPAPATAELLRGARVTGSDLPGETVTPTAAALLVATGARFDPAPVATLLATGYGAGTRQLRDRPNMAVVHLCETATSDDQELIMLETNLDDVTGELLGHVIAELLTAGALDAWAVPAVMKKGRPAHVLHAIAEPRLAGELATRMLAETGSLGLRRYPVRRTALERVFETVTVLGEPVRRKRGPHGVKPEYEDVARAARTLRMPLRAVAALAAAQEPGDRA